jgi:dUTP pyrophosphatase
MSELICAHIGCAGLNDNGFCMAENCRHPKVALPPFSWINIKVLTTRNVQLPQYGTAGAAALDFFIPNDMLWESFTVKPGVTLTVLSGIKLEIPNEYCLVALDKSSIGSIGLSVVAPLIDPDYRGEIRLVVRNTGKEDITVKRGQKLVQFLVTPRIHAHLNQIKDESEFSNTERNQGGFGSTGLYP